MEEQHAGSSSVANATTAAPSSSSPGACNGASGDAAAGSTSGLTSSETPLVFPAADVKYFVGGFHSEVTEDDLWNHFSSFGTVSDVKVMRDAASARSRGFGFVTMAEPSSKQRIMSEKEHIIGGRKASVRPYAEQADLKDSFTDGPILKRKVFVGGVNPALGHEALENYFSKYGPLEDATIMRYSDGRSRGFGFIVFRDEATCQQVLQQRNHCITPRDKVEVKPCLSRGKTRAAAASAGIGGGMDPHYGHGAVGYGNMGAGSYGGPGLGGYGGSGGGYGGNGGGYGGYGGGSGYGYGGYGGYGASGAPNGSGPAGGGWSDYRDGVSGGSGSAAAWGPYDSYGGYYGGWPASGGYSGAAATAAGALPPQSPYGVSAAGVPSGIPVPRNVAVNPGQAPVPRMGNEGYYDMAQGPAAVAPGSNPMGGGHPGYGPVRRGGGSGAMPLPGPAPPYGGVMGRGRVAPY